MSFNWQTEEDGDWDNPALSSSDPEDQKPDGKRRWPRWLIPFGLLLVGLTAAGWTLNQRIQLGSERVETDVIASHSLVLQAVDQQDDEIILNVLSGRDEAWALLIMEAVAGGVLNNRDGLGLLQIPITKPVTPTIEIAPDFQEAMVTMVMPYAIEVGNGLTETIELEQTAVYRLGPNRWLLSPPDLSYWGDIRQIKGQYVNLFYPERDKVIAEELLLSLDAKIGQLCTQLSDVDCPNNYQMIVELTTDPASFEQLGLIPAAMNADRRHLILPTPTLVGLPLDQDAKNALFRGYGQVVAYSVLTDLWGYTSSFNSNAHSSSVIGMLHLAVLDDALRQLGLKAWPGEVGAAVSTEDYSQLWDEGLPLLSDHLGSWYEDESDRLNMQDKRADILVEFLQRELGFTRPELLAGLSNFFTGQTFIEWLQTFPNSNISEQELENAWLSFVYNQTSVVQQAPPVPFPDQDIQLLCQMIDEERFAFYRYDFATNMTRLEQPLNRFVDKMVALPDDNGLAVWEASGDESLTQLFLWVDGEKVEISWDADETAPGPIPLHVDPTNSKLILSPAQLSQVNYGLLDVPSCLEDTCQLETVTGYPVWSPDLAHMILLHGTMIPAHEAHAIGQLTLADETGEAIRPLDIGASPFWLDDELFGFVLEEGEDYRHTIVAGRVDDGTGQDWDVLLTVEDLTAVLGDEATRLIGFVSLDPQNPDQLIIVTMSSGENEQTLFVYDLIREEVVLSHSFVVDMGRNQTYRFSPNGRFLLMSQYEFELEQQSSLYILDLVDGDTSFSSLPPDPQNSVYWMTDFSQDGEWMLVADENILYLSVLGSDYERLIFPETGACKTAVFVNKNE